MRTVQVVEHSFFLSEKYKSSLKRIDISGSVNWKKTLLSLKQPCSHSTLHDNVQVAVMKQDFQSASQPKQEGSPLLPGDWGE